MCTLLVKLKLAGSRTNWQNTSLSLQISSNDMLDFDVLQISLYSTDILSLMSEQAEQVDIICCKFSTGFDGSKQDLQWGDPPDWSESNSYVNQDLIWLLLLFHINHRLNKGLGMTKQEHISPSFLNSIKFALKKSRGFIFKNVFIIFRTISNKLKTPP